MVRIMAHDGMYKNLPIIHCWGCDMINNTTYLGSLDVAPTYRSPLYLQFWQVTRNLSFPIPFVAVIGILITLQQFHHTQLWSSFAHISIWIFDTQLMDIN